MPPASRKKVTPAGPPDPGPFEYTAPGGGTITLPSMAEALNPAELRKWRKEGDFVDLLYYVIERDNPAEDDGSNPALDAIDEVLATMSLRRDLPDLVEKWQEHSKVSLGKS